MSGLAGRGNVSPALRHDAVNGRKAEARAFRLVLGGEERFEDMGQSFLIHAAARVLDGKHDVAAAFEIETGRSGFFEMYICGLDLELSAFRHRIQGVDDEIHQHLLDLAFVGFDAPESVAEIEEQIDVFADERLKHDVHVADDGIQVEYLRLENLFATKSHQLPRHRRCLLRRIVDQKQLRPHGVVAAQAAEKNFAASDDDGKKIVEVMGDTAGQSSNRLHLVSRADLFLEAPSLFLSPITLTDLVAKNFVGPREGCGAALHAQFELVGCAAQLFFEAFSLGDVANVQEQGGLTQIFDAARSNGYGNGSSVVSEAPAFKFRRSLRRLRGKGHKLRTSIRRHQVRHVPADDLFAGSTVQRRCGRVAVENIAGQVLDEDRIGRAFKQRLEKGFAVSHSLRRHTCIILRMHGLIVALWRFGLCSGGL